MARVRKTCVHGIKGKIAPCASCPEHPLNKAAKAKAAPAPKAAPPKAAPPKAAPEAAPKADAAPAEPAPPARRLRKVEPWEEVTLGGLRMAGAIAAAQAEPGQRDARRATARRLNRSAIRAERAGTPRQDLRDMADRVLGLAAQEDQA